MVGWVVIIGIRVTSRVLLSDGGITFSENAESLRKIYVILYTNLTSTKYKRDAEYIS